MDWVMDHIVLPVEDEEAMLHFYTQVLGLAVERLDAYRAGEAPFPSVRINDATVIDLFPRHLWAKEGGAHRPGAALDHFCLGMDREQWTALRERLDAAGVPIDDGPDQRWGARGMGTSIYFRDPEDNVIEARFYDR